jgi:hypothetical protein
MPMAEMGQTEKNSVRAYVFRFTLKLGHRSMQSARLKRATSGLMYRSKMLVLRGAFNAAVDFAAQRRSAAVPPIARKGSLAKSFELLKEASGNAA